MRYLFFTLLLLLLSVSSGCSNNNPQGRIAVRGEVTFNSKPLEQGEILFLSIEGSTPTVATGSLIQNGKFSLPAEHGLIPEQEYCVQFRAVEEIPGTRKTNDPMEVVQTHDIIPPKYGVKSKETVKATKKSPNVFKFDLISDK
ncbi:MAG: hypothetical protein LBI18_11335 [Planctomycetaceae bacterium]|jgi:hypothetical protein|nr:hypothetical protein [Planctomycetaceae bacterium]